MTAEGVDYSSGRPGGKALAAAGMRFAARYLSHNEAKNLTPAEATDLAAHDVSCVVVWETTAQRASAGRAAGIADAKEAAAQAKACGMPSSRPIYFAVDYDAAPSAVVAYFQGVASVLGVARAGVYGGFKVVAYLLDHKLAAWAWQTVAWSGGRWDPRAHIRQYASTVRINGVSCDHDTAMTADYGQWMPGRTPNIEQEDDVELTDKFTIPKNAYVDVDTTADVKTWIGFANVKADKAERNSRAALAQSQANGSTLTALTAKVDKLTSAPAPTIDYAKLAAALIAAVAKNGA